MLQKPNDISMILKKLFIKWPRNSKTNNAIRDTVKNQWNFNDFETVIYKVVAKLTTRISPSV